MSRVRSAARWMILVGAFAAPTILLLVVPEVLAQGVGGIPLAGRTGGVSWAGTPAGVAIQIGVAVLLTLAVIWLSAKFRPSPYRRKGRRSFLEDPDAPMPTWGSPGATAKAPPRLPDPPEVN